MDFHPLRVIGVLHVGSDDPNVGSDRGKLNRRVIAAARRTGISLRHMVFANGLEDEIAAFVAEISSIEQALERRVHIEPAVRITIGFVPNPVSLLAPRVVNKSARHSDALLLHD